MYVKENPFPALSLTMYTQSPHSKISGSATGCMVYILSCDDVTKRLSCDNNALARATVDFHSLRIVWSRIPAPYSAIHCTEPEFRQCNPHVRGPEFRQCNPHVRGPESGTGRFEANGNRQYIYLTASTLGASLLLACNLVRQTSHSTS